MKCAKIMRNTEQENWGSKQMDAERILRTSVFGGFRRADVLAYVEELKNEIAEVKTELCEKNQKLDSLTQRADALAAECAQAQETEQKLKETETVLRGALEANAALEAKNDALQMRVSALDSERAALSAKESEIKTAEAQLGAAFLDARKYSDEIVGAANKKATQTQDDASASIAKQAADVARLSADVDALSATLSHSIDSLHADISALSAKLSQAAQSLANRKDAEKFEPDISIRIRGDMYDNNTENGLTVLQNRGSQNERNVSEQKPNSLFRFDTSKEG